MCSGRACPAFFAPGEKARERQSPAGLPAGCPRVRLPAHLGIGVTVAQVILAHLVKVQILDPQFFAVAPKVWTVRAGRAGSPRRRVRTVGDCVTSHSGLVRSLSGSVSSANSGPRGNTRQAGAFRQGCGLGFWAWVLGLGSGFPSRRRAPFGTLRVRIAIHLDRRSDGVRQR